MRLVWIGLAVLLAYRCGEKRSRAEHCGTTIADTIESQRECAQGWH